MRHHIQKQILDTLATADSLRYSEINPTKLEGNVFTYHLKQLVTDNLVERHDENTYALTRSGRAYIVHRYENTDESAHSIYLVIIRCDNKLLLRKRRIQPMLGYSGFVHGEPKANASLEDTVRRRVHTKTGIDLASVTIHSSGLICMNVDGELNNFSHAILVTGVAKDETLPIESDNTGENYWVDEEALADIPNILPSCNDLIAHSTQQSGWFDMRYSI